MGLAVACYEISRKLPGSERFGLIAQIQRAAASIPANIAEGQGRFHLGEKLHHFSIANGSLKEAETHLLIAEMLGFVRITDLENALKLTEEICRMLSGLRRSLSQRKT